MTKPEKKKRTSGPSGRAKSHTEREAMGLKHIGVWVPAGIREQLDAIAAADGCTLVEAVATAISERFQLVFGTAKKKKGKVT